MIVTTQKRVCCEYLFIVAAVVAAGCGTTEHYLAPSAATADAMGAGLGFRSTYWSAWVAVNSVAHVTRERSQGDSTWRVIGDRLELCSATRTPHCERVDTGGVSPDTLLFVADDAKWLRAVRRADLAGTSDGLAPGAAPARPTAAPGSPASAPVKDSPIRITKPDGDVVEGMLIDRTPHGYLVRKPDGSAALVANEDADKVESPGALATEAVAMPTATEPGATPAIPAPANAVWVRGIPGSVLTAGVGLLAYCVATAGAPRCTAAKFPVENGFVKAVLSVHRARMPEATDIVWLGLGDSASTFWWGAAATEFTVVRCAASASNPTPACELAEL